MRYTQTSERFFNVLQGSAIPHKTEQIEEVLPSILSLISYRGPTDAIWCMWFISDNHRVDIVLWKTEQLPQSQFLQLVLLCSADVEKGRHNVSEQAKEGEAKWKRQNWV